MTIESAVADLTTATTNLLSSVNVQKSTLDASVATATTKAGEAAASATTANTKAGEASGSAASALAIYGSTAAVNTAVANAQAQASLAAGYAASAGSAIQQDISGVTAAALHRSPNAVVAMFVYDTTKDSDPSWTEKCQHTSWYNEPLNGKWLGACVSATSVAACETIARAISGATTGDYFQASYDGKFYKLNAGSGTTEVFRGNKAKFPKIVGIVAESAFLTIYDLTDPGRPMWMRFVNTGAMGTGSISSLAAINGTIYVGGASGLAEIDFTHDILRFRNASGVTAQQYLATRATSARLTASGSPIVNTAVNSVAATVLPDAPVDPVSGLQVPTIACLAGGVSVIKHDGTVVNSSSTSAFTALTLSKEILSAGRADTTWYYALNPGSLAASFALTTDTSSAAPDFNNSNTLALIQPKRSEFIRVAAAAMVQRLKNYEAAITKGLSATITNVFNSGWLVGDIKRAYLADSVVESLTAPELVTNGGFVSDLTGWTSSSTPPATSTWASGGLTIYTDGSVYAGEWQGVTTVVGKWYKTQIVVTTCGVSLQFRVGTFGGAGDVLASTNYMTAAGTYTFYFLAVGTTSYVQVRSGSNGTYVIRSISVQQAVADRSYKARGAGIFGSLTKSLSSPSASNQLVAYSGFSASNYLQEPYSADLDFGTGEWNVSAWVNIPTRMNQFIKTEALDDAAWTKYESTVDSTKYTAPDGTLTAQKLLATTVNNNHYIRQAVTVGGNGVLTFYAAPGGYNYCSIASNPNGYIHFDLTNGNVSTLGAGWASATCVAQANGFYKITVTASAPQTWVNAIIYMDNAWIPSGATGPWGGVGDPTKGILLWHPDLRDSALASVAPVYQRVNTALDYGNTGVIADRNYSSGAAITLSEFSGLITATAYDGTTTRTVTTSTAYNTGTMIKARAVYRLDGSLAIMVNGVQVAVTYGNPLLTLNNSNAVLTIGNNYALNAPFPGSIALLKLSATAPTPDQALWMYEQEKHLFRDGANCLLPDSGNVVDLTYDEATDKWIAVSAANESSWTGLVRTNVIAVPAGSNIKAAASSGIKLNARSTTSPGVDVTIPAWNLREELVKRAEAAAKKVQPVVIFDYSGGFTATTVNGNTAITSVASLTYPAQGSLIGATVTGTGIPASTVIVAISGTTIYLSKACTASNSAVQIALSDFILPVGYETRAVLSAGALKQEGSTKDWTRTFDGFREKVTFGTAPGYSAFVEIQAVRSI